MDQFPDSGPKSKRLSHLKSDVLGDKYEHLGDVWMPMIGYELVLYHYRKRNKEEPICNLWIFNEGKLVIPNVFVSVDLIILLAKNYDPITKVIYDVVGKQLLPITRDYMSRAFGLDLTLEQPIDITLLTNEHSRLKDMYKRWRLPTHRPRDGNNLRMFDENENLYMNQIYLKNISSIHIIQFVRLWGLRL